MSLLIDIAMDADISKEQKSGIWQMRGMQVAWQHEARLEIEEQWDGKGSPPRQWKKSGTP